MKKKICLISANCQGAYLKALLGHHAEFKKENEIHYFVNYESQKIPTDLLKKTDLLIYQPLRENWGQHSVKYLLATVPTEALSLSVNYLTFPIYWPTFVPEPRNKVSDVYPFGPFPYGDRFVVDMLSKDYSTLEILDKIYSPDYFNSFDIKTVIKHYKATQTKIETRRSQKMLSYIMNNYKDIKLFETYNHPARPLCVYQVNDILKQLGYNAYSDSQYPDLPYLKINQQPIHPYITDALNLKFSATENTSYNIWGKPHNYKSYMKAYIDWDLEQIGDDAGGVRNSKNQKIHKLNDKIGKIISPDQPSQIVFIHIPKTAGTSLNQMFDEAFPDLTLPHYNGSSLLIGDKLRRKKPIIRGHFHYCLISSLVPDLKLITFLRNPIDLTLSSFEFMKAHPETWLGKLAQGSILDFLNDANVGVHASNLQTRMLGSEIDSLKIYADYVNHKISYDEYIANYDKLNKYQVDEKVLTRAKARLENFMHVGFTDTFADDCSVLFTKLGVDCPAIKHSNKTPLKFNKRNSYSTTVIETISKMNEYDMQLWEYAKKVRKQGKI